MSSPTTGTSASVRDTARRPALTVLSGFWQPATYAVARTLLAAEPALRLIRHDLTDLRDGRVRRIVRTGRDVLEDVTVRLRHGCLSCTLREDVLPTLARLAADAPDRDLLLMLPDIVEPEAVADACTPLADLLRIDSFVTVVDTDNLLAGLASADDLVTLGIHAAEDDDRALADVIVRQVEYADTVVSWGDCEAGAFDTAQARTLLQRLAPWAAHVHVGGDDPVDATGLGGRLLRTRRHRPETPGVLARGIEGYPLGAFEGTHECDVVSVTFRSRRPFHPQRLADALDDVNEEMLRSRGHLWLASQPETVVAWDFAGGGLGLGSLGRWLAATPDEYWDDASDQRRIAAALDWDPYYGDRGQHLVLIGIDPDAARVRRTLRSCLLTDAELADGEDVWRTYPDPFAGSFPLADPEGA
ncbi:CobW family GTP-binding protein [Catenuloplanes japonicus]|uniref:CobW family GTP-binding protein n=1 Tax=Catenuloplanes japonicus TaxID=33876 RepID=UPI00052719A2|nr:GTP-binding protein [Catenuloplanes japonicus]